MKKKSSRSFLFEFALPLLILILLSILFRKTDLDLRLSKVFWRPEDGWRFKDFWVWVLLYTRGMIPGVLIGLVGLVGLVAGIKWLKIRRQWRSYLLLLLLLAIGPGLLVNSIFKEHWGRTRPKHVVELGGTEPFLAVWERGASGSGNSFPSGHASIGFYVMAPYFVFRRRRARLAKVFLFGGGLYGVLMGIGRIAQGGHFPSDVLWSWGMVYFSGLLLCYLLRPEKDCEPPKSAPTSS